MEERKNNKGLVALIVILCLVILGLVVFIILDNNKKNEIEQKEEVETSENNTNVEEEKNETNSDENSEIKVSDLYGTYNWQENFTTDTGVSLTRRIKLTLNSDGTALYEASDGMSAESTKGKFTFENGYIIYTRQYYNYDNSNTEYTDGVKTERFKVVDENTLTANVSNFNNVNSTLVKQ